MTGVSCGPGYPGRLISTHFYPIQITATCGSQQRLTCCVAGSELPVDATISAWRRGSRCSMVISSRALPALSRFRTTSLMILPPRLLKETRAC